MYQTAESFEFYVVFGILFTMFVYNTNQSLNILLCHATRSNHAFKFMNFWHQFFDHFIQEQLISGESLNGQNEETFNPQLVFLYFGEEEIVFSAQLIAFLSIQHIHDVVVKFIFFDESCESLCNLRWIEIAFEKTW